MVFTIILYMCIYELTVFIQILFHMDSYSNSARTKLDQILHDLAVKAKER